MAGSRLETLIRQLQGLIGGRAFRAGVDMLTWPGGSPVSSTLTVTPGIKPAGAVAISRDTNVSVACVAGITSTTFPLQGKTLDGSSPAAGTAVQVFWLAWG